MKKITLIVILMTSFSLFAAQRRFSSKPELKSLIKKFHEVTQDDGFYEAFLYSQNRKLFKVKDLKKMQDDQKCTKNQTYKRADEFLLYFSKELLGQYALANGDIEIRQFNELLGSDGFLYCVDYESDYMTLTEYHYFVANDRKFMIRFEVGMED
jgi:hypothetical protein